MFIELFKGIFKMSEFRDTLTKALGTPEAKAIAHSFHMFWKHPKIIEKDYYVLFLISHSVIQYVRYMLNSLEWCIVSTTMLIFVVFGFETTLVINLSSFCRLSQVISNAEC